MRRARTGQVPPSTILSKVRAGGMPWGVPGRPDLTAAPFSSVESADEDESLPRRSEGLGTKDGRR